MRHPWLRLLRVPNLLTVPGDVWAGIALAAAATGRCPGPLATALAGVASLCLYGFGLILNDLVDVEEDRVHRPERPLVEGSITSAAAQRPLFALLFAGLLSARAVDPGTFWMSFRLAGLAAAYNLVLKPYRLPGAVGMGMCRATSLLVGATAAGASTGALVAAVGLGAYIAAVTWLAAEEHRPQVFGRVAMLPPAIMLVVVVAVVASCLGTGPAPGALACAVPIFALGTWRGAQCALSLRRGTPPPRATQAAIGVFIRVLIPWQAACVILGGQSLWLGLGLLTAWPAAAWLGRRYAAS